MSAKKPRLTYHCDNCGHQEFKWLGRCPTCQEWGTFREELVNNNLISQELDSLSSFQQPQVLNQVNVDGSVRMGTGSDELDRLLGGGIVAGSVLLFVGDPGIGKSTLSLLTAGRVAKQGTVLYVSGEESTEQIKIRADRLGLFPDSLYVMSETNLEFVKQHIISLKPILIIIDSIQSAFLSSIRSTPGSPSQIKECTIFLIKIAKLLGIPIILVGQVTKDSQLAGPKVLEHLVDTVVYLEGNRSHSLRVARVVKNRFGSTEEVVLFEMTEHGIDEVANPSQYLLENRADCVPGSVIVATARGTRPIFTEIQALVSDAVEGVPPRQFVIGIDRNRLLLVAAVIQQWLGEKITNKNIFVSTAGGIESDDPALDLGIAAALYSALKGIIYDPKVFWIGELTLSGEVRTTPDVPRLLYEGNRLGFEGCVLASQALPKLKSNVVINLHGIDHLRHFNKLELLLRKIIP